MASSGVRNRKGKPVSTDSAPPVDGHTSVINVDDIGSRGTLWRRIQPYICVYGVYLGTFVGFLTLMATVVFLFDYFVEYSPFFDPDEVV